MSFHVGQKVVCVDDRPRQGFAEWDSCERLINGHIYTVTASFMWRDGTPIVHLAERYRCIAARVEHGNDVGFRAARFRPVVERKTDISFAHEILRKASKRVNA